MDTRPTAEQLNDIIYKIIGARVHATLPHLIQLPGTMPFVPRSSADFTKDMNLAMSVLDRYREKGIEIYLAPGKVSEWNVRIGDISASDSRIGWAICFAVARHEGAA
jgi:hypothetical protein